jgi:hypothetical protein
VHERNRQGVNGRAKKVARPASSSSLTAAPPSAILPGGSCLRPPRGQSSLQLADAPVVFGGDLDQGREERDRESRHLLAAALERIPPQLEALREPSESPETATEGEAMRSSATGGAQEGAQRPRWRKLL